MAAAAAMSRALRSAPEPSASMLRFIPNNKSRMLNMASGHLAMRDSLTPSLPEFKQFQRYLGGN